MVVELGKNWREENVSGFDQNKYEFSKDKNKERSQISQFAHDIMPHLKDPKEFTKLLDTIQFQ